MSELSNLLALPSIMDNSGKSTAPPLILGILSRAPGGESFQMAQTVIDRWECVEQRQNLQNAFEQIGSRRNSVSTELPLSNRLKRLDPVVINKVAIGCHAVQFGKVLLLTMADGSVEYRDRFTFEELYAGEDTEKVMNLKQVGWSFSEEGPCKFHAPPRTSQIILTLPRPASRSITNMLLHDCPRRRREAAVEQTKALSWRRGRLNARL